MEMKDKKKTYVTVIVTDGKKFLNLRKYGRIEEICNVPMEVKDYSSPDPAPVQAVIALFNNTGVRIEPKQLVSLGLFESGEDFDLEASYLKVDTLPDLNSFKSVSQIHLCGEYKGTSIPAISEFRYTSLLDIEDLRYSFKGVKDVLTTVFNKCIAEDAYEIQAQESTAKTS